MPWMTEDEIKELNHIQLIRNEIAKQQGMMLPAENQRALGWMTNYYERAIERAAKAKAMRDEEFARLLQSDPDLAIGRAKAIVEGSEFGRKHTYYKNQAEGYHEMLNTFKKNIAYYEGKARNNW